MKITKAKRVGEIRRKQETESRMRFATASSTDHAIQENITTMISLNTAGISIAEADLLRGSLYCMDCMHTAHTHEAYGTHTRCNVCSCSTSRDRIIRKAMEHYKEHTEKNRKLILPAPSATKSPTHVQNQRVLMSLRRLATGSLKSPEFICPGCNHKAKMHSSVIVKGMLTGWRCKSVDSSGRNQCSCTYTYDELCSEAVKDAES